VPLFGEHAGERGHCRAADANQVIVFPFQMLSF